MDVFDLADNLRAEFQEKGVSNEPSICGLRLALGKSFCEIEGWSLPILIVCSFPTGFFR